MSGYRPGLVIHPGRTLEDSLEYYGVTQKWLSERTGLTEKHISNIINGKAPISADVASKIADALGGSTSFWISLEANYQADLARLKRIERARKEAELLDKASYKALVDAHYIENSKDDAEKVMTVCGYFGVSSLELVACSQAIAFRKTKNGEKANPFLVAAWLRKGEVEALKGGDLADFDKNKVINSLPLIREATSMDVEDGIRTIKEILLRNGILLICTSFLNNTYLNGATRWVGNRPVIQISDRGKHDDAIWFTLFHEIGHLVLHSKKEGFLDFKDGMEQLEEKEADDFAAKHLLPEKRYFNFLNEHMGRISKRDIIEFARSERVAPSIVLGRLQKDGRVGYNMHADLKRRVEF